MIDYSTEGDVAVVTMDDGKMNALGFEMIEALHGGLDRAGKDAKALVLMGRPGVFCAGFDLKVMRSGEAEMMSLVKAGAELMLRAYLFPIPLVVGCTGHAIAAGALTLLCGDYRLGVQLDAKIGLNEVAIGIPLPKFAVELARERLSKRYFTRSALLSEFFSPEKAVDVGYLDRLAPAERVESEALALAGEFAKLDVEAFKKTKHLMRRATVEMLKDSLDVQLS